MSFKILAVFAAVALLSSAAPQRQGYPFNVGTSRSDPSTDALTEMTDVEQIKFFARALPEAVAIALRSDVNNGDKLEKIANTFLPAARSIVEERASDNGRSIPNDELETLQITEETLPIIMKSLNQILSGISSTI